MSSAAVSEAFRKLVRNPAGVLVRKWNWKCALFSALTRSWIFFFANLTAGWRAALGALSAELIFRGITSGFYGALTQNFREVEPPWLGALAVMIPRTRLNCWFIGSVTRPSFSRASFPRFASRLFPRCSTGTP